MGKKEQIYEAALFLFNKNGFEKTPTSLLAKEADVSTGTLFHYFSTKEELINSLYLHCKESMIHSLLVGAEEEQAYRDKLFRIYTNFLHWGMDHTAHYLFFQQFCDSVYISDSTRVKEENQFEVLTDIISDGIEREVLQNAPIDYLLEIISALLTVNMDYLIQNPAYMQDSTFMQKSFDYIWRSIKS